MVSQLRDPLWYVGTIIAATGTVTLGMRLHVAGWVLLGSGGFVLGALAMLDAWRRIRADGMRPLSGVFALVWGPTVLLITIWLCAPVLPPQVPDSIRVVVLALGLQAFLLAIDVRPSGTTRGTQLVPLVGHGAMFAGAGLALDLGPFQPATALIAYATGFASLVLHAFWMRQLADGTPPEPDTMPPWEAALLLALISGLLGVAVASFTASPGELLPPPSVQRPATILAGVTAIIAVGTLALPPSPPATLEPFTGTIATVLQHGATVITLLNVLMLTVILVATPIFLPVVGVFLVWLTVAAAIEYLQVIYAHRRRTESPPDPPPLSTDAPVTVIITAAFEASVLPETLSQNIAALEGLPFLVVPAAKSDDGTVEIARQFAADHERVRVVEGTSGSKAGDLNQAWPQVNTEYALILDADEIIEAESVARGLQTLRERPEVGVVQGRKAARHPDENAFSRYVSVERQYSTWIDHPFMDDVLRDGHFGGSVAMFRREVPPAVNGWSPDALTEDIDFTLRLYRETDWSIEYDSEIVGWEFHPATLRALVRQRVRWARGWAQAATRHFRGILESRQKLGWRQTLGVEWLLFTSVSAPVSTIFPVLMALWYVGFAPPLPLSVAVPLALFLLPARAVSFGYAALRDPKIPLPATPKHVGEVIGYAYLWILFGWFVQLHALYLQLSGAPRLWYVTEKAGVDAT